MGNESRTDPGQTPDHDPARRNLLNVLLGLSFMGWAGTVLFPVIQYFKIPAQKDDQPDSVVAAKLKDLKPNEGVLFKFGSTPALLIMGQDGQLRALSAVCTHLECTVKYRADLQKIHCACHNGMYDLNGQNISGPPPRPLKQYRVVTRGDDVLVFRT